jgi:hypothetical protein
MSSHETPTIPAVAINPTDPSGSPLTMLTSPMSESTKEIYNNIVEIGQSAILQNPVTDAITGLGTNITIMGDIVSNSACYSVGDKANLNSALIGTGGLKEQLELFKAHTDTLSGVIKAASGSSTPGLDQIISVGGAINTLLNSVQGGVGCLNLLQNMTGLFSGDLLNGWTDELSGFIGQINNCLGDVVEIISRINEIKSLISGIITADQNFFAAALAKLQSAALAGLLEYFYKDPCGKYVIENMIGRTNLLSSLNKGALGSAVGIGVGLIGGAALAENTTFSNLLQGTNNAVNDVVNQVKNIFP